MKRMNYTDLLALVVEYDISAIQDHLKTLEKNRLSERGLDVVDATPEQIKKFHGGDR